MLTVARATFGAEPDDLVRMTARQFGYGHAGPNIAARLEQRIESLVEIGRLSEQTRTMVVSHDNDRSMV
ncbi:MAG: hypothetical protein OXD50_03310 [Chloroflexi bacterium]|nr:hypothetical protein [Chloroflexota bacterium]